MSEKTGLFIIPAYNEEKRIGYVVSQATKILPTFVIDDGSKDNTSVIAQKNGAQVLLQVPNQGKGEALKRGFREAIKSDYEFVITLDADGQHEVQESEKFITLFGKDEIDLIIGYRDFNKMPFSRRIANTVGGWAFSWAMGMKILDNQSGYRLLSRRLLEKVLESKESGFEFEVTSPFIVTKLCPPITSVATRLFSSPCKYASKILSAMKSQILSGCIGLTNSHVFILI